MVRGSSIDGYGVGAQQMLGCNKDLLVTANFDRETTQNRQEYE